MGHPLRYLGTLLALAAALSACSRFSLLTQPLEQPVEVEVRSLREGGTVQPGSAVKIMLRSEEEGPYSLQIRLADMSGKAVWESTLESPLLNEDLELILPDLALGQYELLFRVTSETETASERRITFFYAPGEYRVVGIQSYPPSLLPGTSTVLKAQLKVPEGADPWLRWTLADRVAGRGSLRDGFDQITWPAPEQEGVYTVRVELFPVPPVGGAEFPFQASALFEAQLYVTRRKALAEDDLAPEKSYFSLFHFSGDLAEAAPVALEEGRKAPEATPIGAPRLIVMQEKVGYQLQASSGLLLPRWALPVSEGRLQPFTLTMGLILQPSAGPRDLFTARSKGDGFGFLLRTGPKEMVLRLEAGSLAADVPSGFAEPADGREHFVSLSVEPVAEGLRLQWFLDGRQTASYLQPLTLPPLSGAGECRLGGAGGAAGNGFSGVVTELGVYYQDGQGRPATDAAVYRRAMEGRHRQQLLAADGFDGLFLSPGLDVYGTARPQRGELALPGEGWLALPKVDLDAEGLSLELALAGAPPPQGRLLLSWGDLPEPFLELTNAGSLTLAGRTVALAGYDPRLLRLEIGPPRGEETGLAVRLTAGQASRQFPLPPPPAGAAGLRLRLENPGSTEGSSLLVDRVLLLRGREAF